MYVSSILDLLALDRGKANMVLVRLTVCLMLAYKNDLLKGER